MSCQPRYSDLVFVGGGLSNTLTFIYLLRMLLTAVPSVPVPRRPRDITILDKNGDFGTGVSYGRAAHPALLLNEPVSVMNFCSFLPWLAANRRRWLMKLQASDHQAVRNWLTCNRKALQNAESNVNSYLPLYLPRCVFGSFLKDRFTEALSAAERSGLFSVDLLAANAVELVRAAGASLKITLENGEEIRSHKVVLGIGSTPKAEFTQLSFAPGYVHSLLQKNDGSCCVDDFAEIISKSSAPRTLVLIGSNAAAMENLYLIANTPAIRRSLGRVIVVSTSGSLPLTHTARMSSEPLCLESFAKQGPHTADKLFTAARNDMACVNGQSAVGFEGRFSTALKNALTILAVSEQSRFVELYGARLVSMNRHAPPEYLAAACRMISDGELQLICGSVSAVKPPKSPSGSFLINVTTGSRHSIELHAAGVVDCRGSAYLCPPPNPLIRSILKENSGVGSINSSGRGIRVNKNFEASEGVYVIGPLLAGHSSETDWLWNLESAPRINSLAQRVAALVSHL